MSKPTEEPELIEVKPPDDEKLWEIFVRIVEDIAKRLPHKP